MLQGLRAGAYVVLIGEAVCGNIKVQDNLITCEPPTTRPQVSAADYTGYNRIPVKVRVIICPDGSYRFKLWL